MKAPRIVEVRRWGSEGWIPKYGASCPYGGDVCCVSGSGSSMCNFLGHPEISMLDLGIERFEQQVFIICGEPLEEES